MIQTHIQYIKHRMRVSGKPYLAYDANASYYPFFPKWVLFNGFTATTFTDWKEAINWINNKLLF